VKRREFITSLAARQPHGRARGARAAGGQGADHRLPSLAALSETADRPRRAAFAKRLAELGWVEGRGILIAYRWADRASRHRNRTRVRPRARGHNCDERRRLRPRGKAGGGNHPDRLRIGGGSRQRFGRKSGAARRQRHRPVD
jgi:hypothetical protein